MAPRLAGVSQAELPRQLRPLTRIAVLGGLATSSLVALGAPVLVPSAFPAYADAAPFVAALGVATAAALVLSTVLKARPSLLGAYTRLEIWLQVVRALAVLGFGISFEIVGIVAAHLLSVVVGLAARAVVLAPHLRQVGVTMAPTHMVQQMPD